jgi:glutamate-ammonia-ligase adenylyltransferase
MNELSRLAEHALDCALEIQQDSSIAQQISMVGMGKLGGKELGYASDLDIVWVIDDDADAHACAKFAEKTMALLTNGMKQYGISLETDAKLRPDGKVGTLTRTISGYENYYASDKAQTWELQALIRARFVCGNELLGLRFEEMARRLVYSHPISPAQLADIRHMKLRIEKERCKDPNDPKLGPGGLSDIEWTTQLLQWRYGARWPKARLSSTLGALIALRDAGAIAQSDWEILSEGYGPVAKMKNRIWLRNGSGSAIPSPNEIEELKNLRFSIREVFNRLFIG